jgi:nucleoside-diphosphate-sugar epimerase
MPPDLRSSTCHTDSPSGASGFLGAWIVHTLLERNYRVRAAVRSPDTANDLKALFKQHADHLEFAVVEDIFKVCGPYKRLGEY